MQEEILLKLDLGDYTKSFQNYLARIKPLFMQGDIHLHYKYIKELFTYTNVKAPPLMMELDIALAHLQKSGVLTLKEIYAFVSIIKYFLYLRKIFIEGELANLIERIEVPDELKEICEYFDEKGELKSDIDERFSSIQNALAHIKEDTAQAMKRLMSNQKLSPYLVDRQIHYLNNQEALLVRGGFNHVLKGNIVGRSSGGFFYVTPENIAKLKSKQSDLLDKKEALVYEYCKKISLVFTKSLFFLKFINKEFDRFDNYYARAAFAKERDMEFLLPQKNHKIKLEKFSHPALRDPKPISVDFGKQVLLVTGVNAGGKTMLLKSILSAALMAKYLLPMKIDATQSSIGSFKEINAILDDPQSVKNDISTFAGRMRQFAELFKKKDMLIGVDEIELGTDSDEAASLFKVIIEALIKKGMKIVITTHHKKLASLMATHEEVSLLAAIYDEKLQKPTFGFLQGTIGKSYAFETALRYGISAHVVATAKEVYGQDQENLGELIQKNIDLELKMKKESLELEQKLQEIEKLKTTLNDEREMSQNEYERLKSQMHFEYTKAIASAREAIKTKDVKDAHRLLNKANEYKKAVHVKKEEPFKAEDLQIGDRIKYGNSKGVIKSIKKDTAMIECNGIGMKVPLSVLKRSGKPLSKKSPKVHISTKASSSSVILDLHGLRAEEAIEKLDKFISDALINGFDEVLVYHGIGTGKLAYAVRTFLKTHPSIIEFSDAPPNQGGFGATIIKL
jgi:DNA mismatch repair protein MutS2